MPLFLDRSMVGRSVNSMIKNDTCVKSEAVCAGVVFFSLAILGLSVALWFPLSANILAQTPNSNSNSSSPSGKPFPFNSNLGEPFNGVQAKSNFSTPCHDNKKKWTSQCASYSEPNATDYQGTPCKDTKDKKCYLGLNWECVNFVRRYYWQVSKIHVKSPGDAANWTT